MERERLMLSEEYQTAVLSRYKDANDLYLRLFNHVRNINKTLDISFTDIAKITQYFIEYSFGRLYTDFPASIISSKIKLVRINPDDLNLIRNVIEKAKAAYRIHHRNQSLFK